MVALGLVAVGILGVVVLFTRSFVLNRTVTNETIAAGLAAEGIEVVKNMIDTNIAERGRDNWTANIAAGTYAVDGESVVSGTSPLRAFTDVPLWFDPASGTYHIDDGGGMVASPFTRSVEIGLFADDEVQVNAVVGWDENGAAKSLNVEDHFYNWRP